VRSQRPICKTALTALIWVVLTTPATTYPLLILADRATNPIGNLARRLPPWAAAVLLGVVLVGLPLIGVILALAARTRIRSSWTPRAGGGYAAIALALGGLATLAGLVIFVGGLAQ
jgi:hypothetical protein